MNFTNDQNTIDIRLNFTGKVLHGGYFYVHYSNPAENDYYNYGITMLDIGFVETSTSSVVTSITFMGNYYWTATLHKNFKYRSTHIINGNF